MTAMDMAIMVLNIASCEFSVEVYSAQNPRPHTRLITDPRA